MQSRRILPSLTIPPLVAIVAIAAFFITPAFAQDAPDDRPNFVIILCDDLGYGDLACYGNKTIKTPNLDRLAAEGIRFTDCYSAAPVCSSSRVGLLTGRSPNRLGVYNWIPNNHVVHLKPEEKTIATLLRDGGYDTAHVGKWHCNGKFNSDAQPQPGDHGFNHWFSTQNNAAPTHRNPRNFVRNGEPVGETHDFSCQVVAGETIDWIKNHRDKDKPFFAFVCFHEPHEPIDSPEKMVAGYPDSKKRGEALYYANVENMDAAVGRIVDALKDQGLADNTLVFFTSDNGPETLNRYKNAWRSHGSPGPLRGMKLHIYDGGIRVPGIAWWPGRIEGGQVSGDPFSGVDLLPTLCDIARVKPPDDRTIDGASTLRRDEAGDIIRKIPLHWCYFGAIGQAKVALRDGDWKIVAHFTPGLPRNSQRYDKEAIDRIKTLKLTNFELYNVREDIAESKDRASTNPEKLKAMQEQIEAVYADVLEEMPAWEFK